MAECCTKFKIIKVFEDDGKNLQLIWAIEINRTIDAADGAPDITYGKAPDEFLQVIPPSGTAPPLVEGKTYLVIAGDGTYVPWARICFTIEGGKTKEQVCPKDQR